MMTPKLVIPTLFFLGLGNSSTGSKMLALSQKMTEQTGSLNDLGLKQAGRKNAISGPSKN
jgi:hypothetical protein